MSMIEFKKYVAQTCNTAPMSDRDATVTFRVLGIISAVGRMHLFAEQEGKRFPSALRDLEFQFAALCHYLNHETPVIEPEENPTYTLPQLTESVFDLAYKLFRQLNGRRDSLKSTLDDVEKALVNLYVVYDRALTFNGGEGITRERLVMPN
ncbi:MAG: hypothetical protein Unbinned8596contig1000_34 [Prokaryotic dsDNA virus sp.]|nr:MAG: hypothetical protein Unbinned8596contig1000_34 [Prokaryotic dsDNA virus sp.]|tara:strand:+ start:3609 stop:4061 length:453 start_codon:yes stop_codon:yes gene_type:complete